MIVVRLEGGLGNQMFQYAFGMQLASQNRTELVLDLSSYATNPEHGYLLNRFSINARELRVDERSQIPARYQDHKRSLFSRFDFNLGRLRRIKERQFGFSEVYMEAGDNCYLVGYWQSEQFFRDVTATVREQFRPISSLSNESARIRERMLRTPSIALHVRRGDYITNPSMAINNLSLDYYHDSVQIQLDKRPNSEAYIFSNDINWCRENLKLSCPIHFIDHNTIATAHEDLWLMTAAESLVIANSTFSWWGAYLSERAKPTVYAPKHWYKPNTIDDQHLNCRNWTLVSDPIPHRQAA